MGKAKIVEGKSAVQILHERLQRTGSVPNWELIYDWTKRTTNVAKFTWKLTVGDLEVFGTDNTKKAAKQDAARNMLMQITEDISMLKALELTRKAEPNFQNHVGNLSMFCSRNNLPQPVYDEDIEDGPAHRRRFTWNCMVGKHREVGIAFATKDAKQNAAQLMYHKLLQEVSDPNDADLPDYKTNNDFIPFKVEKSEKIESTEAEEMDYCENESAWQSSPEPDKRDEDYWDQGDSREDYRYRRRDLRHEDPRDGRSKDDHHEGLRSAKTQRWDCSDGNYRDTTYEDGERSHNSESSKNIRIASEEVLERKYKLQLSSFTDWDIPNLAGACSSHENEASSSSQIEPSLLVKTERVPSDAHSDGERLNSEYQEPHSTLDEGYANIGQTAAPTIPNSSSGEMEFGERNLDIPEEKFPQLSYKIRVGGWNSQTTLPESNAHGQSSLFTNSDVKREESSEEHEKTVQISKDQRRISTLANDIFDAMEIEDASVEDPNNSGGSRPEISDRVIEPEVKFKIRLRDFNSEPQDQLTPAVISEDSFHVSMPPTGEIRLQQDRESSEPIGNQGQADEPPQTICSEVSVHREAEVKFKIRLGDFNARPNGEDSRLSATKVATQIEGIGAMSSDRVSPNLQEPQSKEKLVESDVVLAQTESQTTQELGVNFGIRLEGFNTVPESHNQPTTPASILETGLQKSKTSPEKSGSQTQNSISDCSYSSRAKMACLSFEADLMGIVSEPHYQEPNVAECSASSNNILRTCTNYTDNDRKIPEELSNSQASEKLVVSPQITSISSKSRVKTECSMDTTHDDIDPESPNTERSPKAEKSLDNSSVSNSQKWKLKANEVNQQGDPKIAKLNEQTAPKEKPEVRSDDQVKAKSRERQAEINGNYLVQKSQNTNSMTLKQKGRKSEEMQSEIVISYYHNMILTSLGIDLKPTVSNQIAKLWEAISDWDLQSNPHIIEEGLALLKEYIVVMDLHLERVIFKIHDGRFLVMIHVNSIPEIVEINQNEELNAAKRYVLFQAMNRLKKLLL